MIEYFIVSDFQKFVINTLTKFKYDLTTLTNTVHAFRMSFETFIENYPSTAHSSIVQYDPLNLDELFPITDEESLNNFETKIETNKDFRSNVVC